MDFKLFIVIFMSSVVYADGCRFGSGPNCAFPCNCNRNGCDEDSGDCADYGGCRSTLPAGHGWGGPGCLVGNLAYAKNSSQSTEYDITQFQSSNGNDGKNCDDVSTYTHTAAGKQSAWFWVYLGGRYQIKNVTIYDRQANIARERLIGSTIQIFDGNSQDECATVTDDNYEIDRQMTFTCDNLVGDAVRIYRENSNGESFIHICELVVMGHPFIAKLWECQNWENDFVGCKQCQPGRRLPDCALDCPSGYYGMNCRSPCSSNCKSIESSICDPINGNCKHGCNRWYVDDRCGTHIYLLEIYNAQVSGSSTSSSISISWRAGNSPPPNTNSYYHYIIRYKALNGKMMETSVIPLVDDTSANQAFTISNLQHNTNYEYIIRSVRTVGNNSDFYDSGREYVQTKCRAPSTPPMIAVTESDKGFRVSLQNDMSDIDSGCSTTTFTLEYKYANDGQWQSLEMADTSQTEYFLPIDGNKQCWARILVVNDEELEATSNVASTSISITSPTTKSPNTNSNSPNKSDSDTLMSTKEPTTDTGMIAGVAVAAVVFVALVVIVVLLFTRYRRSLPAFGKKKDKESKQKLSIDVKFETGKSVTPMGDVPIMPGPAPPSSPKPKPISPRPQPTAKPVVQVNTSIPVSQLGSYIAKKRKERDGFKNEYSTLPEDETAPCERGSLPENKTKNRFLNIRAYDHSRVILETENADPFSDYINCNYIPGFDGNKEHYIAGQGPKPHNIVDLWRMIWQKKINRIAMMTNEIENSRRKCDRYWPENVECSQQYGAITVTTMGIERFPFYTIRLLRVQKDGVSRSVRHFHFTAWIDKRIPEYAFPLLGFRKKVRMYDKQSTGPLFVHCSAGVGRTGTFIAIDYLLEQAKHKHTIDVRKWVNTMRGCRINMIQTLEQYIFVYDTLQEALACGDTSIPASELETTLKQLKVKQKGEKISPLEAQYKVIDDFRPVPKGEDFKALSEDNIHKNRDPNIYPSDLARPYLLTKSENGNDYINAVFVHGYNRSNHYLITQMPLPATAVDFWRMVCDIDIVTIVALNEINDEDCTPYWPDENDSTETYGPIEVAFKSSQDDEIASVSTFEITNNENGGRKKEVEHIRMMNWPDNTLPDPKNLIHIVNLLEQRAQLHNEGNVVIHCLKGVSNSGILVAALNMIEKLKIDQEIDVFTAVKAIRINRNMFIESFEQYEYLYQVAQTYKAMNDTYANFS